MHTVLLIDDDAGVLETVGSLLKLEGFEVTVAASGRQGLAHVQSLGADIVLTDLRLPDMTGLALIRSMRESGLNIPVVMMTAYGTIPTAIEATRLGVAHYLEKPLFGDEITRAVSAALADSFKPSSDRLPSRLCIHATERWAELTVIPAKGSTDTRTLSQWAAVAGTSVSTLRGRCWAAGVGAKASLDLARALRALRHGESLRCHPESLLEMDPRTVRRVLQVRQSAGRCHTLPTVTEFLRIQQFVREPTALRALEALL